MKPTERRHLKKNEFASTTVRVVEAVTEQRERVIRVGGLVLLALVIGGGIWWWMDRRQSGASELLGQAMAIGQSSITPAPTLPGAAQPAGTYPSERARDEASLAAFQTVVDRYGSTPQGLTAQYHVGVTLLALNRPADAERAFQTAIDRAGDSIYGPMAKMGKAQAMVQGNRLNEAIALLTELSADRAGHLPVDGVLMELARTYLKAGKPQDARATFKRVVDEFPESPYAGDARQQMALIG
jgi:TolA-binding protein